MAELQPVPKLKTRPEYVIKIDLDDRAFLFPAGKSVAQIAFATEGRMIHLEAVYPFNETHTPPRLLTLGLDDAKDLARRLIDAVYQARTQLAMSDGMRIAINVVANGYHRLHMAGVPGTAAGDRPHRPGGGELGDRAQAMLARRCFDATLLRYIFIPPNIEQQRIPAAQKSHKYRSKLRRDGYETWRLKADPTQSSKNQPSEPAPKAGSLATHSGCVPSRRARRRPASYRQ
jgi:hypothetical protein